MRRPCDRLALECLIIKDGLVRAGATINEQAIRGAAKKRLEIARNREERVARIMKNNGWVNRPFEKIYTMTPYWEMPYRK